MMSWWRRANGGKKATIAADHHMQRVESRQRSAGVGWEEGREPGAAYVVARRHKQWPRPMRAVGGGRIGSVASPAPPGNAEPIRRPRRVCTAGGDSCRPVFCCTCR
uniref:Uncharacterized protein n=1 Tax=Plectus sambesii TaxID=2011161 RepID=A0A914WWJ3_9BILA